jgi:hypothetical protein
MEEEIAADGVTPAHLVFEWLLVEGFARRADRDDVRQTPGIEKATAALRADVPMSAKAYLKAASVFGFHGVYRRLARHLDVVDDDLRLSDNGYALLKVWQREQGLEGFLPSSASHNAPGSLRPVLREAVEQGLLAGHTARKDGWQGWEFFARHLSPKLIGRGEAELLWHLLLDPKGAPRGEVFRLVSDAETLRLVAESTSEAEPVERLAALASSDLSPRLKAIMAYEGLCTPLEVAFDWLRFLSTQAGARTLPRTEFAAVPDVQAVVRELGNRLTVAEQHLFQAPGQVPQVFSSLVRYFQGIHRGEELYDALLHRHATVQREKPPDGKREWFEHADDGTALVRVPYRLAEPPPTDRGWRRPYRLRAVQSFCVDLQGAGRGAAE